MRKLFAALFAAAALTAVLFVSCGQAPSDSVYEARIYCSTMYVRDGGGTMDEVILDRIEEKFGIRLVFDRTPMSGYEDELKLIYSGSHKPDAIVFNSHNDKYFIAAVASGMVIPLGDYIAEAKNLLRYTDATAWEAVKVTSDGDIYMIPRTSIARADGYCVRADWLERVGITIPKSGYVTRDEFREILRAFTEDDPDGNGIDDTSGIMPYPGVFGELSPLALGSFGCLGWQRSGGEYEYMDPKYEIGNENFRAALEYTAELYRDKYIHTDWPVVHEDCSQQFIMGKVGMSECFPGHVYGREAAVQLVNPDARLTYIRGVVDDDGTFLGAARYPELWGGIAITDKAEHPELIVKALDYLLSDEGWSLMTYGRDGYDSPEALKNELGVREVTALTSIMRRSRDIKTFGFNTSGDTSRDAIQYQWITEAKNHAVYSLDLGRVPEIVSDKEFMLAEAERAEAVTRILTGDLPVSAYDKVLESWYARGGSEYVRQMNDIISTVNN